MYYRPWCTTANWKRLVHLILGVFFPHISNALSRLTQVRHQVMALTSSNGASGGGGKVYKVSFMVADEAGWCEAMSFIMILVILILAGACYSDISSHSSPNILYRRTMRCVSGI